MENSLLEIANLAKSNSGYYAQKYLNYEINTNVGSGGYEQSVLLVDNEY